MTAVNEQIYFPRFKAFDIKNKKMYLGEEICVYIHPKDFIVVEDMNGLPLIDANFCRLLQWTGQCDSEGTEIYLDDILEVEANGSATRHRVVYEAPNFPHFDLSPGLLVDSNNFSYIYWTGDAKSKVIGNYNLNPELLK